MRQEGNIALKLKALLTTARQYGPLAVTRAYADWGEQSRNGVDAAVLVRHAIEPIYTIGGGLRNSADIRLAVDAVALCERSPEIATYIIGSGDGGLISVVNYLRLRGRQVIVIAVDASLSSYLRDAADVTLCYEEAIAPTVAQAATTIDKPSPAPPSQTPPPQTVPPAPSQAVPPPPTRPPITAPPTVLTPDWEEIAGWVVAILTAHGPGPYPLTELAQQLKKKHGFEAGMVTLKFLKCIEKVAETRPILITSTPLSGSLPSVRSYFVELIGAPKAKKVQATAIVTGVPPSTPTTQPTKKKATPATKPKTTPPVAKATPVSKPKPAPVRDATELERAFSALPRAVVTARLKSKQGIAHYPAVHLALQTEIGCSLTTLGRKPGAFFAEAACRGLVQTAVLTKGTSQSAILLLPGEPIPSIA